MPVSAIAISHLLLFSRTLAQMYPGVVNSEWDRTFSHSSLSNTRKGAESLTCPA